MATPLKIKDASGNIQQFTTAEENYLAYQIGLQLADAGTDSAGAIRTGSGTSIGSFTNTFFNQSVGTHPSTAITTGTTTYTLYQNQDSTNVAETDSDWHRPLMWVDSASQTGFKEMPDADLNSAVDRYLQTIFTNDYPGTFKLASTSPGPDYSVHLASVFTDTRTDGSSTAYNIYKRTAYTAPSTVRPLYVRDNGGFDGIQAMTNRQIKFTFGQRAKRRIAKSKIGTYQFRTSTQGAPTDPGTWVAVGTATDTKQTTSDQTYTRDSTLNFVGNYTQNYTGSFTTNYTRLYSIDYTYPYTTTYTTPYAVSYEGAVQKFFTSLSAYESFYAKGYEIQYDTFRFRGYTSDPYESSYSNIYTSSGNIGQNYLPTYVQTKSYITGGYTGTITSLYNAEGIDTYENINYTGPTTLQYGDLFVSYTGEMIPYISGPAYSGTNQAINQPYTTDGNIYVGASTPAGFVAAYSSQEPYVSDNLYSSTSSSFTVYGGTNRFTSDLPYTAFTNTAGMIYADYIGLNRPGDTSAGYINADVTGFVRYTRGIEYTPPSYTGFDTGPYVGPGYGGTIYNGYVGTLTTYFAGTYSPSYFGLSYIHEIQSADYTGSNLSYGNYAVNENVYVGDELSQLSTVANLFRNPSEYYTGANPTAYIGNNNLNDRGYLGLTSQYYVNNVYGPYTGPATTYSGTQGTYSGVTANVYQNYTLYLSTIGRYYAGEIAYDGAQTYTMSFGVPGFYIGFQGYMAAGSTTYLGTSFIGTIGYAAERAVASYLAGYFIGPFPAGRSLQYVGAESAVYTPAGYLSDLGYSGVTASSYTPEPYDAGFSAEGVGFVTTSYIGVANYIQGPSPVNYAGPNTSYNGYNNTTYQSNNYISNPDQISYAGYIGPRGLVYQGNLSAYGQNSYAGPQTFYTSSAYQLIYQGNFYAGFLDANYTETYTGPTPPVLSYQAEVYNAPLVYTGAFSTPSETVGQIQYTNTPALQYYVPTYVAGTDDLAYTETYVSNYTNIYTPNYTNDYSSAYTTSIFFSTTAAPYTVGYLITSDYELGLYTGNPGISYTRAFAPTDYANYGQVEGIHLGYIGPTKDYTIPIAQSGVGSNYSLTIKAYILGNEQTTSGLRAYVEGDPYAPKPGAGAYTPGPYQKFYGPSGNYNGYQIDVVNYITVYQDNTRYISWHDEVRPLGETLAFFAAQVPGIVENISYLGPVNAYYAGPSYTNNITGNVFEAGSTYLATGYLGPWYTTPFNTVEVVFPTGGDRRFANIVGYYAGTTEYLNFINYAVVGGSTSYLGGPGYLGPKPDGFGSTTYLRDIYYVGPGAAANYAGDAIYTLNQTYVRNQHLYYTTYNVPAISDFKDSQFFGGYVSYRDTVYIGENQYAYFFTGGSIYTGPRLSYETNLYVPGGDVRNPLYLTSYDERYTSSGYMLYYSSDQQPYFYTGPADFGIAALASYQGGGLQDGYNVVRTKVYTGTAFYVNTETNSFIPQYNSNALVDYNRQLTTGTAIYQSIAYRNFNPGTNYIGTRGYGSIVNYTGEDIPLYGSTPAGFGDYERLQYQGPGYEVGGQLRTYIRGYSGVLQGTSYVGPNPTVNFITVYNGIGNYTREYAGIVGSNYTSFMRLANQYVGPETVPDREYTGEYTAGPYYATISYIGQTSFVPSYILKSFTIGQTGTGLIHYGEANIGLGKYEGPEYSQNYNGPSNIFYTNSFDEFDPVYYTVANKPSYYDQGSSYYIGGSYQMAMGYLSEYTPNPLYDPYVAYNEVYVPGDENYVASYTSRFSPPQINYSSAVSVYTANIALYIVGAFQGPVEATAYYVNNAQIDGDIAPLYYTSQVTVNTSFLTEVHYNTATGTYQGAVPLYINELEAGYSGPSMYTADTTRPYYNSFVLGLSNYLGQQQYVGPINDITGYVTPTQYSTGYGLGPYSNVYIDRQSYTGSAFANYTERYLRLNYLGGQSISYVGDYQSGAITYAGNYTGQTYVQEYTSVYAGAVVGAFAAPALFGAGDGPGAYQDGLLELPVAYNTAEYLGQISIYEGISNVGSGYTRVPPGPISTYSGGIIGQSYIREFTSIPGYTSIIAEVPDRVYYTGPNIPYTGPVTFFAGFSIDFYLHNPQYDRNTFNAGFDLTYTGPLYASASYYTGGYENVGLGYDGPIAMYNQVYGAGFLSYYIGTSQYLGPSLGPTVAYTGNANWPYSNDLYYNGYDQSYERLITYSGPTNTSFDGYLGSRYISDIPFLKQTIYENSTEAVIAYYAGPGHQFYTAKPVPNYYTGETLYYGGDADKFAGPPTAYTGGQNINFAGYSGNTYDGGYYGGGDAVYVVTNFGANQYVGPNLGATVYSGNYATLGFYYVGPGFQAANNELIPYTTSDGTGNVYMGGINYEGPSYGSDEPDAYFFGTYTGTYGVATYQSGTTPIQFIGQYGSLNVLRYSNSEFYDRSGIVTASYVPDAYGVAIYSTLIDQYDTTYVGGQPYTNYAVYGLANYALEYIGPTNPITYSESYVLNYSGLNIAQGYDLGAYSGPYVSPNPELYVPDGGSYVAGPYNSVYILGYLSQYQLTYGNQYTNNPYNSVATLNYINPNQSYTTNYDQSLVFLGLPGTKYTRIPEGYEPNTAYEATITTYQDETLNIAAYYLPSYGTIYNNVYTLNYTSTAPAESVYGTYTGPSHLNQVGYVGLTNYDLYEGNALEVDQIYILPGGPVNYINRFTAIYSDGLGGEYVNQYAGFYVGNLYDSYTNNVNTQAIAGTNYSSSYNIYDVEYLKDLKSFYVAGDVNYGVYNQSNFPVTYSGQTQFAEDYVLTSQYQGGYLNLSYLGPTTNYLSDRNYGNQYYQDTFYGIALYSGDQQKYGIDNFYNAYQGQPEIFYGIYTGATQYENHYTGFAQYQVQGVKSYAREPYGLIYTDDNTIGGNLPGYLNPTLFNPLDGNLTIEYSGGRYGQISYYLNGSDQYGSNIYVTQTYVGPAGFAAQETPYQANYYVRDQVTSYVLELYYNSYVSQPVYTRVISPGFAGNTVIAFYDGLVFNSEFALNNLFGEFRNQFAPGVYLGPESFYYTPATPQDQVYTRFYPPVYTGGNGYNGGLDPEVYIGPIPYSQNYSLDVELFYGGGFYSGPGTTNYVVGYSGLGTNYLAPPYTGTSYVRGDKYTTGESYSIYVSHNYNEYISPIVSYLKDPNYNTYSGNVINYAGANSYYEQNYTNDVYTVFYNKSANRYSNTFGGYTSPSNKIYGGYQGGLAYTGTPRFIPEYVTIGPQSYLQGVSAYTRPGTYYIGALGDQIYTGSYGNYGNNDDVYYGSGYEVEYAREQLLYYLGTTYLGGSTNYIRAAYSGPSTSYSAYVNTLYTVLNYEGPVHYLGSISDEYQGVISRSFNSNSFTGVYSVSYLTQYVGENNPTNIELGVYDAGYGLAIYTNNNAHFNTYISSYVINYLSEYTGFFSGLYTTLYNIDYIGDYSISYTADYQTDYTGDYSTEYTGTFDAIYQQDYLGNFAGDFAGETIDATSTTNETYTLYVRIA